jgi:hypothetical protein
MRYGCWEQIYFLADDERCGMFVPIDVEKRTEFSPYGVVMTCSHCSIQRLVTDQEE